MRECEARRGEGGGGGGGDDLLFTHRAGEPKGGAWLLNLTGTERWGGGGSRIKISAGSGSGSLATTP